MSTTIVAGQPISWAPWSKSGRNRTSNISVSEPRRRSLCSTWWQRLSTGVVSRMTWTESCSTPMRPSGSAPGIGSAKVGACHVSVLSSLS